MLPTPTPSAPPGATSFSQKLALTSTTAPGKIFSSRSELQEHYKSDWHRYNLKRREAELPMLNETDFNTRLEAAVALRKEREGREERSGADHRKDKSIKKTKKSKKQTKKDHKRQPMFAKRDDGLRNNNDDDTEAEEDSGMDHEVTETGSVADEEEQVEINPCQSLFDNHISQSPESNLEYMTNKHSFFLPDSEYCVDLEGLLGYCSEKIRIGHICLYCQKMFKSGEAVLKHMIDKRHCKILYEAGKDLDEFGVFYDFSEANKEFLGQAPDEDEEEDEEGWEDVSEDESMVEDQDEDMSDDDDLYAAYEKEITTHGFDITPLGELGEEVTFLYCSCLLNFDTYEAAHISHLSIFAS
jgi:pre-60S factor REI1